MADIDLDQPATVSWLDIGPEDLGHEPGWHGMDRSFETLREAVRFCVEGLDLRVRNFARIATGGTAPIDAAVIEELYRGLET